MATDERWQALLSGQWVFVDDVRLLVTRVDDAMTMTVSGHFVPEFDLEQERTDAGDTDSDDRGDD